MDHDLANQRMRGKPATHKRKKPMGIIFGGQRIRSATWDDVIGMARNGFAVIRDGTDIRLCWSEAFETEAMQ
jgi:hypothetical protein